MLEDSQRSNAGFAGLRPLHVIQGNPYLATVMAVSADGHWLVTGCEDRTLTVINAKTGATHRSLEGHEGAVRSVAISSDGKWVASAEGELIKLWDVETSKSRNVIKRPRGLAFRGGRNEGHLQVASLCFSPDGETLVSVGPDRKGLDIKAWEVKSAALTHEFSQDDAAFALVSPKGETLATASGSRSERETALRLWNLRTGTLKGGQLRQEDAVVATSFSWNGRLLAVASAGHRGSIVCSEVDVWDMSTGKKCRSWDADSLFDVNSESAGGAVVKSSVVATCLGFAPDNDTLLIAGGTVSKASDSASHMAAYSVISGARSWRHEERGPGFTALATTPGGLVATATRHSVKLWQVA